MPDDCLFCNMASGAFTVDKLHDDDAVFAIRDISPRAPSHFIIIPKEHIPSARELTEAHGTLLGHIFATAAALGREQGLAESGYRLAFNAGPDAGQTVYHLHLHLLGGHRLGPEG